MRPCAAVSNRNAGAQEYVAIGDSFTSGGRIGALQPARAQLPSIEPQLPVAGRQGTGIRLARRQLLRCLDQGRPGRLTAPAFRAQVAALSDETEAGDGQHRRQRPRHLLHDVPHLLPDLTAHTARGARVAAVRGPACRQDAARSASVSAQCSTRSRNAPRSASVWSSTIWPDAAGLPLRFDPVRGPRRPLVRRRRGDSGCPMP